MQMPPYVPGLPISRIDFQVEIPDRTLDMTLYFTKVVSLT